MLLVLYSDQSTWMIMKIETHNRHLVLAGKPTPLTTLSDFIDWEHWECYFGGIDGFESQTPWLHTGHWYWNIESSPCRATTLFQPVRRGGEVSMHSSTNFFGNSKSWEDNFDLKITEMWHRAYRGRWSLIRISWRVKNLEAVTAEIQHVTFSMLEEAQGR